jgi:hypothetical protein
MRILMPAACALLLGLGGCGGQTNAPADLSSDQSASERRLDDRLDRAERRLKRLRDRQSREHGSRRSKEPGGFDALARSLGGEVGVAVGAPGTHPRSLGRLSGGPAWSTIKVAIALRVIEEAGSPSRLSSGQRTDIERALTASDNAAAARLFGGLGSTSRAAAATTEVLREAGDDSTVVSTQARGSFSPYGQTDWSLSAQHRLVSALVDGCVADAPARTHILSLMGRVSSDSWGLGSAGRPARWKGGWGPDPSGSYLARQMGVLEYGARRLVVALAVKPSDGSFESAQRMATAVGRWVGAHGGALAGPARGC